MENSIDKTRRYNGQVTQKPKLCACWLTHDVGEARDTKAPRKISSDTQSTFGGGEGFGIVHALV